MAAASTPHIALWGDSMVPPVQRALDDLYADRQVHNGGIPGETSQQVLERQKADTERREWITVFWVGHNNIRLDPATAPKQVKADLANSVATLAPGNDRFVVLSLVNNAIEARKESPDYQTVVQLNRDLAATYPDNFLDMRRFLVNQSDPASEDYQADVPASWLRLDDIHLSGAGADVVARRLAEFIAAKGW